jgi:hypothetical protein
MIDSFESSSSLPPEVLEHYASGYESQRLLHGASQIELVRTQELVMWYVPSPPCIGYLVHAFVKETTCAFTILLFWIRYPNT